MTPQQSGRTIESRLVAALTDTARRNLPDATVPPPLRPNPDSSTGRPAGRIRSWGVPALAAAVVVTLAVGAFVLVNHGQDHRAGVGNSNTGGTFVTLRARTGGLSATELATARKVISARAAQLGAKKADVQVVGNDEITAFLPGVAAADVANLGAVDAVQFRPLIVEPIAAPAPKTSVTIATGPAPVVDPWTSLGFAPPTDTAGYNALSVSQQQAVRAVLRGWNCFDKPLDRADAPIVACDQTRP